MLVGFVRVSSDVGKFVAMTLRGDSQRRGERAGGDGVGVACRVRVAGDRAREEEVATG